MNKNVKRIFFVTTLLIMLVAVSTVSATDNTTNTDTVSDTTISDTSNTATNEVIETSDNTEVKTKNNNNNKNNIKKEAQTITLNSNNFDEYVTDGKFNEKVNDGDTIDITGKLDHKRFTLELDKPVNIISSNGEAYINLARETFKVSQGASGSNITGIRFVDTHISIENVTNIIINNISTYNGGLQGYGSFSVRDFSNNVTVKNSYFKTENNGGTSNVVFAGSYNCLFENNTVIADGTKGFVGNVLYLTTYNALRSNENITIRNNIIRSINTDNMAICYGLALEGKGHIIEGNTIDNKYAVMAQYADIAYGMETQIDQIIFNNNTILRGTPQLVFPGIVSNNTFLEGATLKQVDAYNNQFNTVFLQNNVNFENNTAKNVIVSGDNNTLTNNEVFSDEDYAVTITGNNNTLNNNKIAGYIGRGENAISNTTEIVSINNSEEFSRTFYIDANNINNYTNNDSNIYTFKEDIILKDGDIILFNFISSGNIQFKVRTTGNITIMVIDPLTKISRLYVTASKCYIVNSSIPRTILQGPAPKILINSIVGSIQGNMDVTTENSFICFEFTNNTYVVSCGNPRVTTKQTISKDTGYFLDSVNETSRILVHRFLPSYANWYTPNIYVDRQLYFENIPGYGDIDANVTFVEGSEFTTVNGITFKQNVYVNTENIKFTNCIFNGEVIVNSSFVNIENCTFGGKISLNNSNSLKFEKNIITSENSISIVNSRLITINNNTITTAADNTIVFDEESNSNTVKNNILIANTLLGDDSVVGGDNTVEDNGPSYNTSIEITSDDSLYKNDEGNVTVTVYNLLNNTPVDKGYVEVYLDGVLQGIKTLVNGQVTLEFNTNKSSLGTVPLKVWYYDGKYANNVTSINVDVVKSNLTITVDEFTAKLNENATVTATFRNQNGNPVSDTNVTFTIGRSSFTVETVDGVATLNEIVTKDWLDAGRVTISFPNTDSYNSNTTRINMNLTKDDVTPTMTVSQENDVVNIYMELVDSLNNSVTDGKITVTTIDGTQLNSTRIRNGTYNTTITLPEDYTENLIVNYTNSYYYNDFTQEIEITNNITETITKIDIPEIALINTPIEIKATVTDTEGNIINNGLVVFTIDDEVIAQANITEGIATATVTFNEEKELTIKATYQKTKEFASSNAETTINIQKPTTQLNIEDVNITAGETVTLTATVTDQAGNNITGGKIIFKVNGKTVKDTNGKVIYAKVVDGVATVEYIVPDNLSGKDVNITAVYSGSSKYNKESTTITKTVAAQEPTLTITPITDDVQTGSTITLKAKIAAGDKAITTGKIVFKINGKTVKDANGKVIYAHVDANGEVSVDYNLGNLKAGTYTIEATFIAPGKDKITSNTSMTVVKA